ncbi:MAG: lipocalin family protein [Chitinophagales bacterium]
MKNLKVCLCFVLAISLFTSSCTKEEELSKTELLTIEEGWLFDSSSNNAQEVIDELVSLFVLSLPEAERTPENEATIREELGISVSENGVIEDCDEDNSMIFNRDNTLTEIYGAIRCDADEPNQAAAGTWSFSTDETELILTNTDGEASEYSLQTLNANKLELVINDPITTFLELFDLTTIENVEGYDDFINSSFTVALTFKSN